MSTEREHIIRAAVAAMPNTNPQVAEDLIQGFTMHTEADDIVAIWQAARVQPPAPQPAPAEAPRGALAEGCKRLVNEFGKAAVRATAKVTDENLDALVAAENALESAIECLAALPAPAVQAGWRLVPEMPTDDMIVAGVDAGNGYDWSGPTTVYKAMLAAATQPTMDTAPPRQEAHATQAQARPDTPDSSGVDGKGKV